MNKKGIYLIGITLCVSGCFGMSENTLQDTQQNTQGSNSIPIARPALSDNDRLMNDVQVDASNEESPLNRVSFPRITVSHTHGLNETGKSIIESIINEKAKNLKAWQKEKIEHCAITGDFEAYSILSKVWGFIGSVSYPLANLAHLVNSVLPLLSFGLEGDQFTTKWKIAISISGVLALFLEKVSTFAYDTASKEVIIYDILQLIKARQEEENNELPLEA